MSSSAIGKVTVAILSWNGRSHLETCLDSLEGQDEPGVNWEVVVLDNGSIDDTSTWLDQAWPPDRRLGKRGRGRLRRVRSERNLGFCAGNNQIVSTTDADAVALLNNDTRAHPGWLAELTAALGEAGPDVAAVSGLILDWSGQRLDFVEGAMTFDGHAFQRGFRQPLASVALPEDGQELLFPCGGNMMVRRRCFLEAGGFDEDFFAYLEDVDLGWRLWAGGERVELARGAVVNHRSMATSDSLGMFNRGFLFERNAFLCAYKNYDHELWPRLMPAVLWTLISRTQTLLVENNPLGDQLTIDPYATQNPGPSDPQAAPTLSERWRVWGTRELMRRAFRRGRRELASWLDPDPGGVESPRIEDPRTIAQFRALWYLLGNTDRAAKGRAAAQSRRKVPDRTLFERFPLLIVPTYPGDERLFGNPAFSSWLPEELSFERCTLDDLMAR